MSGEIVGFGGALLGIAAGGLVGFSLGRRYRARCARGRFWVASVLSVLLGMVVMFGGYVSRTLFISGAGVGLMTGGLNGLRWGMGRLSDLPRRPQGQVRQTASDTAGQQPDAGSNDANAPHPVG